MFKRLSSLKSTAEIQWALQLQEQVKWFIKLKDSGLISATPELLKLIEVAKSLKFEESEPLAAAEVKNSTFSIMPPPSGLEEPAELLAKVQKQIVDLTPKPETFDKHMQTETSFTKRNTSLKSRRGSTIRLLGT